jgi:DNA repair protein RecN (Recombination protein N)
MPKVLCLLLIKSMNFSRNKRTMLSQLTIKNVALIENATICFSKGLNVLSGETGAGKSVILDSVNFVLGAKADRSMIRYGESECMVKAEFILPEDSRALELLRDMDIETEGEIIISRRFSDTGKSTVKINGNTVTAAMLRTITDCLVDVHGQSEHFALLKPNFQLKFIDNYHDQIAPTLEKLKHPSLKLKEIAEKKELLGGSDFERAQKLDILSFQISEIENANLAE